MTFSIASSGDNPFAPGAYGFQYLPDQLIAGPLQLVTHNVLVMSGGVLPRGTVLGRLTNFSFTATPGTNTGNGTVGTVTPGSTVEGGGNYVLTATSPTVFNVTDPEGVALGTATVGQAFNNAELGFTITAGGTAFVAGDSFALAYRNSAGNFIPCIKTANDGSQQPQAILVDNIDTTNGPVQVGAYFMGEFNLRAITYDSSWTSYDMVAALGPRGIHLHSSISAADPT